MLFRDQITNFSINQVASNVFDEPNKLADFAAAAASSGELINAQLQSKLGRDVDSKIVKWHQEYYLMEQLKGVKKELGMESNGKDKLIEKFRRRAAELSMPGVLKDENNTIWGVIRAYNVPSGKRSYPTTRHSIRYSRRRPRPHTPPLRSLGRHKSSYTKSTHNASPNSASSPRLTR